MDNHDDRRTWDRFRRWAWLVGLAALAVCLAGAVWRPALIVRSYLVAWCFWFNLAVGSLPILMVYHLTGGAWGLLIRRVLEASVRTLPWVAILLLPVLVSLPEVYPWAQTFDGVKMALGRKAPYFTTTFFLVRAAVYFTVWLGLGLLLCAWSRAEDAASDRRPTARMRTLSGPGLVLYWLTMTFASVDWVMSLEPWWYSTIFPVVFIMGQVLAALAFTIVVLALVAPRTLLAQVAVPRYFSDLGNLLLALVMFWAYVAFSQFLLIWMANLPEEVTWYTRRFHSGWGWMATALLLLQFVVPFLALLPRRNKRTPQRLAAVAGLLLVTSFLMLFWQIVPAFQDLAPGQREGLLARLIELAVALLALVGIGGAWLGLFLGRLGEARLVPIHDPTLTEVLAHG